VTSDIESRLRRIFADVFALSVSEIQYDSSPETIEAWDSLQHLVLVSAIAEEFSLRIEPEDGMEMLTFGRTLEILRSLLGRRR
jgi:acyl carrier protein